MSHIPTFAELLKRHRVRARLSQEELAERAGLSARAISDLERGPDRVPRGASVRLLAGALGLSEEERAAFEAAARGEAAPTESRPDRSHGLPLQLTPFIGREREMGALRATLLRKDVRLVTLTGPGGTGKTRLALRVAEALLGEFADGVSFVPLAPITEPDLVAVVIGQEVGVTETPARSLTQSLEQHLRDRQMLLVLDNFEQVVSAAPLIARLLVTCPHLKVLARSRVVLRLTGEQSFPVSPLTLPDPRSSPSVGQVQESEAVRLFVARAQSAKPSFGLTEGNAPVVAEICRRLDGLPLAVELAAARVRLLSPQAMLPRLGNRLALLTGGAQDLPARQETVRAMLDWSYELLGESERVLLARLAVFAGGCTLEGAEAVCGPEGEVDVFGGRPRLWTAASCGKRRDPMVRRAFRCWRRFASTRLRDWPRAGKRSVSTAGTPSTTWRWPKLRKRSWRGHDRQSGSSVWRASTTTCGRCWGGRWRGERSIWH